MKTIEQLVAEFNAIPSRYKFVPELDEKFGAASDEIRKFISDRFKALTYNIGEGIRFTDDMVQEETYYHNVVQASTTCILFLKDGTIVAEKYTFDDPRAFHRSIGAREARARAMGSVTMYRDSLRKAYTPVEEEKTDGQ